MRVGCRVMSDDVGFKSFCAQKEGINGVAMLYQNFIIYLRTLNGFSVGGVFKDEKWFKVARNVYIG